MVKYSKFFTGAELSKSFFSTTIRKFCRNAIKTRNYNNYDNFIVFCDDEGNGKTTANIQVAKVSDKTFKINTQRVFNQPTYETINRAIKDLPPYTYLAIDEGDVFYKRNWNKRGQKEQIREFMKSRKDFKNIGLCIPRFEDLDEYIRNHRAMFRIEIPFRGVAVVFRKDVRYGQPAWHLKTNSKKLAQLTKGKYKHQIPPTKYINYLRRLKGYVDDFYFSPLTKEEDAEYKLVLEENYKEKENREDPEVIAQREAIEKYKTSTMFVGNRALLHLWKTGNYSSQQELAETIGVNQAIISKCLNKWKKKGIIEY